MLIGNVFQQMYNVVDSIIVGNFMENGKEALGAVGASFPILFVLISLIIGFAQGAAIIVAQFFGAKDFKKVKAAIDTLYIVLFFASFVITGFGIYFTEEIFGLIDMPADMMEPAKEYFTIIMAGIITMFGFNGTAAALRGLGDSKTPLYFLILSTVLNIILDVVFVLVLKFGISGVAYATVIAQAVSFFASIYYLNRTHKIIYISMKSLTFDFDIFKQSLRIGLPSGLQQMFVAGGMMALFKIVNGFGTDVIAAYSVAGRIDLFALMPAMNFAAALTTFVGQNLGANKPERVKRGLWATWVMTSIISVVFTITAILFGRPIMGIFTPETHVISIGAKYLLVVGVFYITFSTMFSINAVFRGAGDTLIPMFITLFSLWIVRVPVSWYLSTVMGEVGIWWGIPIAWISGMLLSFVYYLFGNWKTKVIVKPKPG